MFDNLEALVAQRPRVKVFAGRQVDPGLIQDAEDELGIPLPESYKEWLLKFGNLRVGAHPVLTLAPRDVRDISDSDLIYNFRLDARDGELPVGYISIHLPDTDESFYFDASNGLINGEYPVVRRDWSDGSYEPFAEDFRHFLEEIVRQA
ncbi:SMI1/KNR4 family protein [Stenotrophomonas sp. ZAC14A_NAIMI4_1]|uniref:SMI1/KNR4 family protein n=1 Tax=Stenotrophomonas sp. ZAC14A_NAIMI4_1 TaxID=2072412 RepID=UPI000D53FC90|nr:SMI1/KNR4 family protein [Stenotrophomonas sp. ZAC14A_NAIMI4_1]AWH45667.1 hypothetical protein C1926_11775 [Stenotrophomonas sp. ZAC14A_NAIMI4_1]